MGSARDMSYGVTGTARLVVWTARPPAFDGMQFGSIESLIFQECDRIEIRFLNVIYHPLESK